MQVGLRWLRDYVDIEAEPELLAHKLTMAGLEVEAVERWEPAIQHVVVARILDIKAHPRADKLSLCSVTDGRKIYTVVCGAPNIQMGDVVPLAKIGALLPSGATVKEARIRGELSSGMLCSEVEMGVGSDASGVMVLCRPHEEKAGAEFTFAISEDREKRLSLGEELGSALDLLDFVFTISVTPNRPDCLSVIGLAREIAALTDMKLKLPGTDLREGGEAVELLTSVAIDAPDLCPHYTARIIKRLQIGPSPFWMRARLERAGMRAISNIVDATNFVMMEMGQPLHAFDYHRLVEGRIVVRKSLAEETFTTLDDKERKLNPGVILICDGAKPVAIGGVMGGINSEVSEATNTVLLESAYFEPASIRMTAKFLGMSTDASFRFERGVDPGGVIKAQNRAARLMANLAGGSVCQGFIDRHPRLVKSADNIPLRVKRVWSIAGAKIETEEILSVLSRLEMTIKPDNHEGTYLVTPPTFRVDIEREIDLIEEVTRVRGYDSIPATLPVISPVPLKREPRITLEDRIRGILRGNGYSEIISYSFISPQWVNRLGFGKSDERTHLVHLKNPLAEDQSVMRTSLLCGLLETMKRNIYLSSFDLRIFEVGKVFFSRGKGELPLERNHLACLLTGIRDDSLCHAKTLSDYYDLKGCAESIFAELRIGDLQFRTGTGEPFLHPGKSSLVTAGGREAGFLGEVHRDVLDLLDIKNRAFVMELDMDILTEIFSPLMSYHDISRFPAITRDAAFLVNKAIEAERILTIVREMGEELLEKVCIFDVYEGKGIPEGMCSLGLRFTYRSSEKTLTDEEIMSVHGRILEKVITSTGSSLRG